jgi:tetratricopeptide (TPR) repeat protein
MGSKGNSIPDQRVTVNQPKQNSRELWQESSFQPHTDRLSFFTLRQRVSSESWEAIEGQESYVPRALLLAQLYGLVGQSQQERNFYDAAVKIILAKARQFPDKAPYRSALGIAYAGLGRKQDAIREGKAGVELKPVSKDVGGYVQLQVLARIYARVGEQDEALRMLEQLLSSSKIMDTRSLRQDPEWKPLRDNPKFQALLRKYGV